MNSNLNDTSVQNSITTNMQPGVINESQQSNIQPNTNNTVQSNVVQNGIQQNNTTQTNTQIPTSNTDVKYEEVESKPSQQQNNINRTDSYFDGKVLDLIGWKILSALVTIVTATIAYPWGKCMVLKYIYGHTVYNGKRLKFEGTGGDLFVQRLKWIFFTIITLGIYAFWIPVKTTNWELSHTHFEDEPLVDGDSYFDGKFYQLYFMNLLCNILSSISLGLLFPYTVCLKYRWIAKHSVINKKKIVFDGKALSLIGHYLLWILLSIITFGIYAFWLEVNVLKWKTNNIHIKVVGEEEQKTNTAVIIILSVLCSIIALLIVSFVTYILSISIADEIVLSELEQLAIPAISEASTIIKNEHLLPKQKYDINKIELFKSSKYDFEGYFSYTNGSKYGDSLEYNEDYSTIIMKYNYGYYYCTTSNIYSEGETSCSHVSPFDFEKLNRVVPLETYE